MERQKVLIVNDAATTRRALERALEPLGHELVLAASGEDALDRLADPALALVLLDLKMEGLGGLDVLRRIERDHPSLRVVVLAENGSVEEAVESMKHGAFEVLQQPYEPDEVRELVRTELDPAARESARHSRYAREIDAAKTAIRDGALDHALAHLRRATRRSPDRPEAPNLIGVVHELRQDRPEAQKHYRIALDLDPTYAPARENLEGSTRGPTERGAISLGREEDEEARRMKVL